MDCLINLFKHEFTIAIFIHYNSQLGSAWRWLGNKFKKYIAIIKTFLRIFLFWNPYV